MWTTVKDKSFYQKKDFLKPGLKNHQRNNQSVDLYSVSFKLQKPQSEQQKLIVNKNSDVRNSFRFQDKQNKNSSCEGYRLQSFSWKSFAQQKNQCPLSQVKTKNKMRQVKQYSECKQISTSKNPFARTNQLFKNSANGKHSMVPIYQPAQLSNYKQHDINIQQETKSSNIQQTDFIRIDNTMKNDHSLPQEVTLFDSFAKSFQDTQQIQVFTDDHSLQFCSDCNKKQNLQPHHYESNSSKQIKIWEQYSVINDDFECPPSNIRTTNRRTDRCVTTPAQNENCKSFFFLTQNSNQDSSQNIQNQTGDIISNFQESTIKEFCFNLGQNEQLIDRNQQNKFSDLDCLKSKKSKIKKIIQEFLQKIQQLPEEKLTNCVLEKIEQSLRLIFSENNARPSVETKRAYCQNQKFINNQLYNQGNANKFTVRNDIPDQYAMNFNFQKSLRNNSSYSQRKMKKPQFGVGLKRDSSAINNSDRYLRTTSKTKSQSKKQTWRCPGKSTNTSCIDKSPKTARKLF